MRFGMISSRSFRGENKWAIYSNPVRSVILSSCECNHGSAAGKDPICREMRRTARSLLLRHRADRLRARGWESCSVHCSESSSKLNRSISLDTARNLGRFGRYRSLGNAPGWSVFVAPNTSSNWRAGSAIRSGHPRAACLRFRSVANRNAIRNCR